jgi:hypothetical protein
VKAAALLVLIAACRSTGATPSDGATDAPIEIDARTVEPTPDGRAPDGPAPLSLDGPAAEAPSPADTAPPREASKLMFEPWPGTAAVMTVDRANQLGMNVSGLAYLSAGTEPAVLLAVQNGPSKMYRLVESGGLFVPDGAGGWTTGKTLHYPDGKGAPDAEGVALGEGRTAAYVATEQDLDQGVSRLSVLRYDLSGMGAALVATHEWNLTAELPSTEPNLGLESIAFVPDGYLTAHGFADDSTGAPYQPDRYGEHGGGLFLVAMEARGSIFAYVLEHGTGAARRVATIASGQLALMDLAFDAETGALFAACDDNCGNRITVLGIDGDAGSSTHGHFVIRRELERPATLPNTNNEGITLAPLATCVSGQRRFFWTDDAAMGGHALRAGSIPCGSLVE